MTGPLVQTPLERLIGVLDFAAVQSRDGPELHVCATNVRTGKIRIFTGAEITDQALLASACRRCSVRSRSRSPRPGGPRPTGTGGYGGNPALFPLFLPHLPDDILIVSINPFVREELPRDALDIANRVNKISFNSSPLRELRAVAFVKRLIAGGQVRRGAMKAVLVHMVGDDGLMNDLNIATKTIPVPVILARLRAAGRAAMHGFLRAHKGDLGQGERWT